jgi:hypothetical protein
MTILLSFNVTIFYNFVSFLPFFPCKCDTPTKQRQFKIDFKISIVCPNLSLLKHTIFRQIYSGETVPLSDIQMILVYKSRDLVRSFDKITTKEILCSLLNAHFIVIILCL